ncbi:ATP synthase F1 subunit gamma [Patescibacteria group bacterium]|nr:ATP synthase F1 subunit gamma [Patescibacteria group bacterium]
MSSIKEIRKRIKSVNNTAKITHAMELVAAAKMKRAQYLAISGKPYSNLINNVLRSIANRINPESHPLLTRSRGETSAVIFFSTDRGLAGSLNSNLFKQIENVVGKTKYIAVGKKASSYVARTGKDLVADFSLSEKPTLEDIRPISKLVIDGFLGGEFDQVHVLYTQFINTLQQEAKIQQVLPIIDEGILAELAKESEDQGKNEPIFEPNADTVLESILPQYILMELYHILLEAKASEHSARMVAMKSATDNANDLVDDLTLTYNSIRQSAITNEILDISTAQVAME